MIERKIICDICKKEIHPEVYDAISIEGNVCAVDKQNNKGVGGGHLGGHGWIERIVEYNPSNEGDDPVDYQDIPIHHVHINCLHKLYSKKRV